MATFFIPAALRAYCDQHSQITLEDADVISCVQQLILQYPRLQAYLLNDAKELHDFINIYVNNNDIRALNGHDTTLGKDDRVDILLSLAGG